MGGAERRFPPTEWTQLLDHSQKEAILAELCARYWKPLYSYLRASGFGNDKAKDLVQGFLTEKVIDQELIRQADKTKGKLRTFLLTAIRNYAVNVGRSESRRPDIEKPLRAADRSDNPEIAYDRAWADQLLQNVIEQLRIECDKRGKTTHWLLFKHWLLEPDIDRQKPQMADLCEKLDIETTAQAYHMIENMKRRFRSILREQLHMVVGADGEVDAEIGNLINIFQKSPAR
jgi:RNA polymerase sigma-70 factor (ECF subfamily)